jgi:acylphosphatase
MDMLSVNIHVSGKVQGVFFRESARRMAESMNITGSVRNLDDGRVLIEAQGRPEDVKRFIKWCHNGPPAARVQAVLVESVDALGTNAFTILR